MRPLQRPTIPSERLSSGTAYGLLMNVFGAYCSISDEPLYDVGYVWDRNNVEHPAFQAPAENWDNLLLLSPATRDAWTRHRDNLVTSELLLPDTDSTFSLENSPF